MPRIDTLQRIDSTQEHPLHDVQATRAMEQALQAALPAHALMQRAGLAVARLALALAPNARTVWIACGPGNNGGDGLEAAAHLKQWGKSPVVTWLGAEDTAPLDAHTSLRTAREAGVAFASAPPSNLSPGDLCIDALLGIGSRRAAQGRLLSCIGLLNDAVAPVLSVDVPTGLDADSGHAAAAGAGGEAVAVRAAHTLSLLTLKPGLFTGLGRDMAGQVWLDALGATPRDGAATARLLGPQPPAKRRHASHKGSYGDVAVLGGAVGMTGAALLAASAALHGGAGRVFVVLLQEQGMGLHVDPVHPALMFRHAQDFDWRAMTLVCGCGGGDAVREVLPRALSMAARLVLDADALNAIASDSALQSLLRARASRGYATVLTPHPLEAARLLGMSTSDIQSNRLGAALQLAERFQCVAVLKGSGTVIAAPGRSPAINPTGNARLATAGTGDVLAGLIGARWAAQDATPWNAACAAVFVHGRVADAWPSAQPFTASALSSALR
jgi:ADP-dependent NAD(P)H-hydrate dehydratase / NAD(P)H-hydrate epimerase